MDPSIFNEVTFEVPDQKSWRQLAEKALKGAVFEDALVGASDDGIPIEPLYQRDSTAKVISRNDISPWKVVQRIDDTDPARANRQVQKDLEGGASGLAIVFEGAPNAYGYGLPSNPDAMAIALDGIPLEKTYLRIDTHPNSQNSANWLMEFLSRQRANPKNLQLSFGIDPAARFGGTGKLRVSIEALLASMPQSLAGFFALGVPGVLIEADGRVYHNAGATEAQELGAMIATAVTHMRMFDNARQPLVYSAPYVGFSISADQDQFMTMAKIRALRLLWQKVQEECGIEPSPAAIHAETSYSMMAEKDPETNILRTTIAAFSAAAGGADSISVLPHTIAHGLPDAFARRIARNTQLVVAQEAGITNVADPAAGSGGVEYLTNALCEHAWDHFRRIEAEGGILTSLRDGKLQERIDGMLELRKKAVGDGKHPIVGTTLYPAPAERPVQTLKADRQEFAEEVQSVCRQLKPVRTDTFAGASS